VLVFEAGLRRARTGGRPPNRRRTATPADRCAVRGRTTGIRARQSRTIGSRGHRRRGDVRCGIPPLRSRAARTELRRGVIGEFGDASGQRRPSSRLERVAVHLSPTARDRCPFPHGARPPWTDELTRSPEFQIQDRGSVAHGLLAILNSLALIGSHGPPALRSPWTGACRHSPRSSLGAARNRPLRTPRSTGHRPANYAVPHDRPTP